MKVAAVIVLLCLSVALAEEKYTEKWDNVNLDDILENERLFQNYFNCLTGAGPCTPDGAELKKYIPEALKTECAKCSDKHKEGIEKVLKYLIDKKPDHFKELQSIYDPDGTYMKKYESRMKELKA